MKARDIYRISIICALAGLAIAGCSREIKDRVSSPIDTSSLPPTPSNLTAEIGDGFIALSWTVSDSSLVASYNIYRADSALGDYVYSGNSLTRSYVADNLQNGMLYYFAVRAVDGDGFEGYLSDPIAAIPNLYSILINGGNEFTNSRNVGLGLSAPAPVALRRAGYHAGPNPSRGFSASAGSVGRDACMSIRSSLIGAGPRERSFLLQDCMRGMKP